ncbi:pirin family protein [Cryptosporangium phraense]|uniref:Pirin family protein n=1 Tax=Cryptosporangium phraense TaxID=2593070 RepID=A0A545AJL7_9ACTN|nr:pirin family protein [Cryptosporangium phraense]TQS41508.1 pirin family protein [Cryptosporangium phraense]
MRALHPYALVAGAIAAVHGVVIGALGIAGYFYLDDIDMTAEAAKHPFGWDYLTLRVNDHLTPGLRLFYWISASLDPYGNDSTMLARIVLQTVATLLMAYLLAQLFGPGRTAAIGVGLYAFCPLLVPSLLSLSSGVNLLPTHIGILLLLVMHVRYEATRQLKYAAFGALGIFLAVVFWEKAALSVGLAPLLTFLYLSSGGPRARLRALLRSWPAWVVYFLPMAAFAAVFVTGDYASSRETPSIGAIWDLFSDAWTGSMAPAAIGGPWQWFSLDNVYYSASSPGAIAVIAGQVTALALCVIAVRRNGWWALRAWLLPASVLAGTAVLLAAGRYEFVGVILARNFHYLSEITIALVLAELLLVVVPDPAAVAARGRSGLWPSSLPPSEPTEPNADVEPAARTGPVPVAGPIGIGLVVAVLAYAISYGVTVSEFEKRWVENPIRDYMTTALRDLDRNTAKGPISVYDTYVSPAVANFISGNRRVSDVFRPTERHLPAAVRWDDVSGPMLMFDQGGHLLPARFVEEATSVDQPGVFCPHPLRGVQTVTVMLDKKIPHPDGFLRLTYLAQTPTTVSFKLGDGPKTFAPRRFSQVTLKTGAYTSVLLGTPNKGFDRVVVTSTDPASLLCLVAKAGRPEPTL